MYKIEFHEISVAEEPEEIDRLLSTSLIQLKKMEEKRKQPVWSMSRVISNILGGGRGSLPPELGSEEKESGSGRVEKVSFKTVFKKRSV